MGLGFAERIVRTLRLTIGRHATIERQVSIRQRRHARPAVANAAYFWTGALSFSSFQRHGAPIAEFGSTPSPRRLVE